MGHLEVRSGQHREGSGARVSFMILSRLVMHAMVTDSCSSLSSSGPQCIPSTPSTCSCPSATTLCRAYEVGVQT